MQAHISRRCALITGGASGIGAALAARLATDGYRIVVADINEEPAYQVAAGLPGGGHLAVAMDVSLPESVEQAFDTAETLAGPVDILVNAAGVLLTEPDGKPLRFWESGLPRWERNMAINARGCLLTASTYVRRRLERPVAHGRIVLFSSVAAQTGGSKATFADYAASKAAVLGFMRAAARECAPLGITVNAVSPGQIETPMLRKNIPAGTAVDPGVIPLARFGQPQDVAATIGFIISPDADFITGATFDVNGGQRMQ
ncbi:MAG: SDR family oxidoreductase [Rhodocyclaceae bacterium]|jgi:3-oxoacyl-[acyl-carrier protein] reductase|nr:SDR family oxidoreductase [Rhodocyclaceae bacterium]